MRQVAPLFVIEDLSLEHEQRDRVILESVTRASSSRLCCNDGLPGLCKLSAGSAGVASVAGVVIYIVGHVVIGLAKRLSVLRWLLRLRRLHGWLFLSLGWLACNIYKPSSLDLARCVAVRRTPIGGG